MSFLLCVADANDAPVVYPDTVTRKTGKSINIALDFVLRNDKHGDKLTVSAVSKSVGGAAVKKGGKFITYTPKSAAANSTDRFTYTVNDSKGKTKTGTVYVNVGTNGATTVY
jgi:hypothetical protein